MIMVGLLPVKSEYDPCLHVASFLSSMITGAELNRPQMAAYQKIHVRAAGHIAEVGLQDLAPAFNVRVGNRHMAVEATWPH